MGSAEPIFPLPGAASVLTVAEPANNIAARTVKTMVVTKRILIGPSFYSIDLCGLRSSFTTINNACVIYRQGDLVSGGWYPILSYKALDSKGFQLWLCKIVVDDLIAYSEVPGASCQLITATNGCLVYQRDGVFSGGIPVVYPDFITWAYLNGGPAAGSYQALVFFNGELFKVDFLSLTVSDPPSTDCVGIF